MTLRIRQVVFVATDLTSTVELFEREMGLTVAFRDPLVGEFGLHNALLPIGDQFIEVVSPLRAGTAAGRHLARHGDSAYMIILQTDDFDRERTRIDRLGVRVIWSAEHPDIRAAQLHPKDIGAAIVSIDQATPPESWRWAGSDWREYVSEHAPREICETTIGAVDPSAAARRWSEVLGTPDPVANQITLTSETISFTPAEQDRILSYRFAAGGLPSGQREVTICGTTFTVS